MKSTTVVIGIAMAVIALGSQQEASAGSLKMKPRGQSNFAAVDHNGDGKISLAEFKAAENRRIEQAFKRLDLNDDGFISDEEWAARRGRAPPRGGEPEKPEKNLE